MAAETFELWDIETGNLVSDYLTEAAALDFVRTVIETQGTAVVMSWELARGLDDADTEPIAAGRELIQRAVQSAAH